MLEYRRLTLHDIDTVYEMNRSFRTGFIAEKEAQYFLTDKRNWLYAALENEKIVGFAYGYELKRLDRAEPMVYIHEVGVKDTHQRQGIGYSMMKAMLDECRKCGICKCFLTTYQNNAAANALYRKLGGSVPAQSQGNDTVYWFQTT